MHLCRAKDWVGISRRCRSNPEEATPLEVPESHRGDGSFGPSGRRCVNGSLFGYDEKETIYYETPLGLACTSSDMDNGNLHEAVKALILACPSQVRASQLILGHTPLRAAVLNPCCDVELLKCLLDAEEISFTSDPRGSASALAKQDRNGHMPIDYLVMNVQLGTSLRPVRLFREYVCHKIHNKLSEELKCSPLIKLFAIGSSRDSRAIGSTKDEETSSQRRRILEATKCVLENDSSLLSKCSKQTDCSPLHVALRNFGNYLSLINVLTSTTESKAIMAHRNRFGDLPLHVACSVGVPYEVLSRIVDCTIAVAKPSVPDCPFSTHPLVWSVNNAGCTPVDLECVRHIEGAQGFHSTRSFPPLEPSGVRSHCIKQDQYYHDLLREAVEHAILQDKSSIFASDSALERLGGANNIFGCLLDRISLLVTAASSAIPATSSPTLLHNVCKLFSMRGPDFPGPIMDLFLWLRRDQLLLKDIHGMVPLHYSISRYQSEIATEEVEIKSQDWTNHVLQLLKMEPEASKSTTQTGRLPLHIVLDYKCEHLDISSIEDIVQHLVRFFPQSVDYPDPITGLDPFLLAARHFDVAYFLLRRSPSRCARAAK